VRWVVPRDLSRTAERAAGSGSTAPVPAVTACPTAIEMLSRRFPPLTDPSATGLGERFVRGEIVRADGSPWATDDVPAPGDEFWFHRELRPEHVPDLPLDILARDEHLLVLDKPHAMATMPRGAHVLASALVRLRRSTGITTLSPLHRLDRDTAGVLAFGIRPEERSAYQQLFASREVDKTYLAWVRVTDGADIRAAGVDGVAAADARGDRADIGGMAVGDLFVMEDRLVKTRSVLQTQVVPGSPNARTEVEVVDVRDGAMLLELRPRTGRTHQLRVQLAHRGMPIVGDRLYPQVRGQEAEEGATGPARSGVPLQLLAQRLAFTDPVTGQERVVESRQRLGMVGM
jgi:tRNA pseudouridine32 synthase/23S rRNA pseudouridine746 synthase